jgi:hypothetical protein
MLENRAATAPMPPRQRSAVEGKSLTNRSAITNDPMRARASGRTSGGRRVRDLYRCYLAGMSNPDDACRAQVLAAAELVVAAENARAELLAGRGDIEQIVRLENLATRAVRRLGSKRTEAPQPSIRDVLAAEHEARMAREEAEAAGDAAEAADADPNEPEAAA